MKIEVDVGRLLASLNIEARQRHDEWTALCPNPDHDDRRAGTWRIVDAPGEERHGLMNCWSCGLRGDAIDLTKLLLGVGYHAAACWIAEFAQPEGPVEVPRLRVEIVQPKTFRLPAGVEELPLARWPTLFRRYLERRKIPGWQVERWRLAFAIEGRLAGRVVLPTRNQAGKLLTYAARAIGRDRLRYLTPSREDGLDSSAIFGEEHWGPGGMVVVTEGAFDALAVEREVADVAVAVLGSGGAGVARSQNVLTRAVKKLERFDEVIVATDADPAGDQVAEELAEAIGERAKRARPPEGIDWSKLCEQGREDEVRGIIEEART